MRPGLNLLARLSNQGDNPNLSQLQRRLIPGRLGAVALVDGFASPARRVVHAVPIGNGTFWCKSWEQARNAALTDPKAIARALTDPSAVQVGNAKVMPSSAIDSSTVPQTVLDNLDEDGLGFAIFTGLGN